MRKNQKETSFRGSDHNNLLVLLKQAQEESGCVSEESISEIAQSLGISQSDVYGVATFYSFLSHKPLGRNVIRVCKSLPCNIKDSQWIIKTVEDELGIKPGETTDDGSFSLELTNCIGACDEAPAMLVNNDVHVNLSPNKISEILKAYR